MRDLGTEFYHRLVAEDWARRKFAEERYADKPLNLEDLSLVQFVTQTDEETKWRIEGLHAVGHNTTLTAAYKSGKSTMMINLLRSLADGAEFLGQTVERPAGKTAYWNLEVSAGQMRDWCRKVNIEHGERVIVANLRGVRTNLWSDESVATVEEWLRRNEIECWIIDPGARLLPGWPGSGNPENDNGVIGELADRLDTIKVNAGVEDLWVPLHTGKNGTAPRGAARWDDWADALWRLSTKGEGDEKERHMLAFGRDVDFPEVVLGYDPATHREWCIGTAEESEKRRAAKTAVFALRNGPLSAGAMKEAMKMKNGTDAAARADAVRRGWITESGGSPKMFALVADHPDVKEMLMASMPEVRG